MNRFPDLDPVGLVDCYIAGGAVLSTMTKTSIADYDIYPKNENGMLTAFDACLSDGYCVNITENAVTFKINQTNEAGERMICQVITFDTFKTHQQIFESFDFTVSMGAFDCDTKNYHFDKRFWPDIASKSLGFNPNTKYPLNSLLRLSKYKEKGFYFSKAELLKLGIAIIESGLPASWKELEDQIGGTYGREIKLNSDGIEFTIENMYKLFDDMGNFSNYEEENGKFHDKDIRSLSLMFSKDTEIRYFKVGDEIMIDFDGVISSMPEEAETFIDRPNWIDVSDETRVGYKYVRYQNGDAYYTPGIRTGSTVRYEIGKYATEPNHPHIFVNPRKQNRKWGNNKLTEIQVEYKYSDIKKSMRPNEIQVETIKDIRETDNDIDPTVSPYGGMVYTLG